MNEVLVKSFLINTYSLMNLLPEAIERLSHVVHEELDSVFFKSAIRDIKEFYPLFTPKAFEESLANAKKLNETECQVYLSALEDKFKNIYKANEVIAKHDPNFIERVELLNKNSESKFFNH